LSTGSLELVSVNSTGIKGDADSYYPSISTDGRYLAFQSFATNLVKGDTNGFADVFVRDRHASTCRSANLKLMVTSAPVTNGTTANHTFTVTNKGPTGAKDVRLIDVGPQGVLSLVPSQGSCKKSVQSVCSLGTLAPGASATVHVVTRANLNLLNHRVTVSGRAD